MCEIVSNAAYVYMIDAYTDDLHMQFDIANNNNTVLSVQATVQLQLI